ncbi:MAG: efflux RND transporter periplasmic adaptor subunit, partial [Saprospiraceae bacterium]
LQAQTLKSEIDLLRIQIDRMRVTAPYDGYLGLRRISPGAYVTPATPLGSIRAVGSPKLDFTIPEKYGSAIRIGQTVRFAVQGAAETFHAEVIATEQRIDEQTRNLQVRAILRAQHPALIPGAFANVSVDLGANREALFTPAEAIIPQARNKQIIVSRNGKAEFVTVETGIRQAGWVEVTKGLQAGDTIAVTGVMFLRPGDPLRFSKLIAKP